MKKLVTFSGLLFFSLLLIAQVEKKVIIEHFTNSRCGICASRNPTFYQTLEDYPQILHIAYHPSSPYASCVFSQHNPTENDNRAYYYGVYGGTPRAVIQGSVIPVQNPLIGVEQIEAHLGKTADYKVTVANSQVSGNTYKVTVEIARVSGANWETVLMFAGLAEEEVQYEAPNGENLHHDVFRKRVFYDTVSVNTPGSTKTMEFEYTMDAAWVQDQMFAYVMLQDYDTKEAKQSASSLDSPTGITSKKVEQLGTILYPNPANAMVSILPEFKERFASAELYSLTGNRVAQYKDLNVIDVSEQSPGMYFMVLTDKENQKYTTRLVKTVY